MNLAEFASTAQQLVKAANFHKGEADHYLKLFNAHRKEGNLITDDLTPLQQFYQRMCEHHSIQSIKIHDEIEAYTRIADGVLFE